MSVDYQKYLAKLHSQNITPDEVIINVAKEITKKAIVDKTRIVAGEANEVYDIEFSDYSHVIVRISRSKKLEFEQEKWAIEKCAGIGIPVPEVLLIKHMVFDDKPLHICIQKKLEGEPLERGAIDFYSFSEDRKKEIMLQAGEILSKIHSIKTKDFGELNKDGEGNYKTFAELMRECVDEEKEFMLLAKQVNFDASAMRKVLDILKEKADIVQNIEPILNHNDFGPKHIMIKNETISGILDFGEVCGHSPINDFAKWDYWFGDVAPIEWLKKGYLNKDLFGDNFDEILHWILLSNGLWVLSWYHKQKYLRAVEKAKEKLYKDLEFYTSKYSVSL